MALLKLSARFVHADTGAPLSGPTLRVRFMDKDAIKDDLLGESALDAAGRAEIVTTSSDFRSGVMGLLGGLVSERKPDVYCEVTELGTPIFRTQVKWNLDPAQRDAITKQASNMIDLGTFAFKRGEGLTTPTTLDGGNAARPAF